MHELDVPLMIDRLKAIRREDPDKARTFKRCLYTIFGSRVYEDHEHLITVIHGVYRYRGPWPREDEAELRGIRNHAIGNVWCEYLEHQHLVAIVRIATHENARVA